jgi:hypothetical protein
MPNGGQKMICPKCEKNTAIVCGSKKICPPCFEGRSLKLYAAASDLVIKREWVHHVTGWVIAPSYASWVNKLGENIMPYMVDNGAWTDHLKGVEKTPEQLLERTLKLCKRVVDSGASVRFMVLPDVVGSWQKTRDSLNTIAKPKGFKLALPIQDGFTVEDVVAFVEKFDPSYLFVGGSGYSFKRLAIEKLSFLKIPIHVGKIHRLEHLCEMALNEAVVSVDTSTFSRPQSKQRIARLGYRLEAYESWTNGTQRRFEI